MHVQMNCAEQWHKEMNRLKSMFYYPKIIPNNGSGRKETFIEEEKISVWIDIIFFFQTFVCNVISSDAKHRHPLFGRD